MPAPKNPSPLTARINLEARAIRRVLNIIAGLDRAARGRVLRTVIEMADEAVNAPTASETTAATVATNGGTPGQLG